MQLCATTTRLPFAGARHVRTQRQTSRLVVSAQSGQKNDLPAKLLGATAAVGVAALLTLSGGLGGETPVAQTPGSGSESGPSIAASDASGPKISATAGQGLDTSTRKEGVGATIEYSDISKEPSMEVVRKLREEVLPVVIEKLEKDVAGEGSSYPASIVQELQTVRSEIEMLQRQVDAGGSPSNIKSMASGIEQQVNALKAILGFD